MIKKKKIFRQYMYIILQEEREAIPENLIKCTICSAMFCNKKAYDVHNTYHQPDDLYVTSEHHRQKVTKVDQDFDIRRVEHVVEKYIPRSNNAVYKRKRTEVSPVTLPIMAGAHSLSYN